MEAWRILHITDFHITDRESTSEHLRLKFYDEYLNMLANEIRKMESQAFDCLVATGDFVNRSGVNNFDHAHTVVSHLADKLGINLERVAVCNGNHDVVRSLETVGQTSQAREPFKVFASSFANGKAFQENDRGTLCKIADDIWCLMIDATLGANGEDRPGDLSDEEADDLIWWIKQRITSGELRQDNLLIIGTHYPVHDLAAQMSVIDENNPRWAERHIWHHGAKLRERIKVLDNRPVVLWLCGDIHKAFNVVDDRQGFITTGRLGTRTGEKDSQVRRQARVILIPKDAPFLEDASLPRARLYEFEPAGHSSQAQVGRWKLTSEKKARVVTLDDYDEDLLLHGRAEIVPVSDVVEETAIDLSLPSTVSAEAGLEDPGIAPAPAIIRNNVELIDHQLQTELINAITSSNLYHFGRFKTSESDVSLSWVSIGPLMNQAEFLPLIIKHMAAWLARKFGSFILDDQALILGLDCWGAALASQLSVLTGIENFCVAARAQGQHNVASEVVGEEIIDRARRCQKIVMVSDVVASGHSLRYVYDQIQGSLGETETQEISWYALSIICDFSQPRTGICDFLSAHGTVCSELKMPVLPVDALPNETVLPCVISFK